MTHVRVRRSWPLFYSLPAESSGNARSRRFPVTAQLTLQLVPGIGARFRSLKECVACGIYQRGVTAIAGKLDRSPSYLTKGKR